MKIQADFLDQSASLKVGGKGNPTDWAAMISTPNDSPNVAKWTRVL